MGPKVIVFPWLFLATLVLISSEVAAETFNVIDTTKVAEETNGAVNDAKYGGPGGGYDRGYGGRSGGYCRYGCCGRSYYRGGCRCCTYAGERPDAEPQAKPQN